MTRLFVAVLLATLSTTAAARHKKFYELTAGSIQAAVPNATNRLDPSLMMKVEVLLDRDHFSPGQIDGRYGDNFRKALRAFQQANNLADTGNINAETWTALTSNVSRPVLMTYTISETDVAGPFAKRIPVDLELLARVPGLSCKSPIEELAEKFHMSETLLRRLNPGVQFDRAGTKITVADVQPMRLRAARHTVEAVPLQDHEAQGDSVATIVVDKAARDLRAFDKDGKLLAFYPATIGSQEKPAPTGTFAVRRVARNPDYHYNPKFAWKGVKTRHELTIKGSKQSGGTRLDRSDGAFIRHSRNPGAWEYQQGRVSRLHPSDQLGRARSGCDGPSRHGREIRGTGFAGRGADEPDLSSAVTEFMRNCSKDADASTYSVEGSHCPASATKGFF